MRLTLITTAMLGAAIAVSACGLVLVRELSKNPLLASPSWKRKQLAWCLLIGCELIAIADRFYYGGSGRWIAFAYITLFLLAVTGMVDSYRLMLKDLSQLYGRLRLKGSSNNGV